MLLPQTRFIHHLQGTFRNIWEMPAGRWRMHFVLRGWGLHGVPRGGGWELHSHWITWKSGDDDGKQGDEALLPPENKTAAWEVQGGFCFHSQPFQCLPVRGKITFLGITRHLMFQWPGEGIGVTIWATEGRKQQESCGCCSPDSPVNKLTQNTGVRWPQGAFPTHIFPPGSSPSFGASGWNVGSQAKAGRSHWKSPRAAQRWGKCTFQQELVETMCSIFLFYHYTIPVKKTQILCEKWK